MTRTLRHLAATGAVVALLATAAACGSEDSSSDDTSASGAAETTAADSGTRGGIYGGTGSEAPAETSAAAPAEGAGAVTIANFAFDPADVEVAAGTTVTWTNDDSFESEDMSQGDTFDHTFDAAGTFDYICAIHPSMKGTVTVTG